jgi:hypothetical protein
VPSTKDQEAFIIGRAWDYQFHTTSAEWSIGDVDLESLQVLEERMFEVSKEAGQAGYWQWGLDAGDHQDGWFVYGCHPSECNRGDGDFEDDFEVGLANFSAIILAGS